MKNVDNLTQKRTNDRKTKAKTLKAATTYKILQIMEILV